MTKRKPNDDLSYETSGWEGGRRYAGLGVSQDMLEGDATYATASILVAGPEIVWVVDPIDKFPEWIEFEGRRYPCKLTPKGITMYTGRTYRRWTLQGGFKDRLDNFRYHTSVPDWGDDGWYGICSIGFEPFHDAPDKLDPEHGEASQGILERLAQVRTALAHRDRKDAEVEALRREAAFRREQHTLWHEGHFQIERTLLKAIRRGEFEKVEGLAQKLHDSYKERPPR